VTIGMHNYIKQLHIIWLSLLLCLTACAFDKEYSLRNPANISKEWATRDPYTTKPVTDARCFAWWQQYHDPDLNHLIESGLNHNNDIQVAMANIEAAEGELKKIKLTWLPSLVANAGYSSFPYLGFPGVLTTVAIPLYTVNIFNQIKSQQKAYYELKVTQSMRDGIKLTIIADIAAAYFSHLSQIERLELLQRVELDLTQSLRTHEAMYKYAITSKIEVDNARARLSMIQGEETVVKKNLVFTQNALRFLINQNPQAFLFKKRFKMVSTRYMIVNSLPWSVIRHRPDVCAAINELQAKRAGIGMAFSHFLPQVNLGLARGDIATVPNGGTLGTAIHFNQFIATQPIVTLDSLGGLDAARGISKASYFHYVNTVRKALRDVDNDLAAHRYATERLKKTTFAQNNIHNAYHLSTNLYKQGLTSHLQLLEEKIKFDEINIVVNQHKIDQILALIHLYEDLAVGYDYNASHD